MKVALVVALLLLSGCAANGDTDNRVQQEELTRWDGVTRHVDTQAGVVCWIFIGIEKGGISCLPISDTRLVQE